MLRKVVGEAQDVFEASSPSARGRTNSNMSADSQAIYNNNNTSTPTHAGGGGTRLFTPTHNNNRNSSGGSGWGISGTGGAERGPYTVPEVSHDPVERPEFPVSLESADLQTLLKKKPELVEFLLLEIANMKLETAKLTSVE